MKPHVHGFALGMPDRCEECVVRDDRIRELEAELRRCNPILAAAEARAEKAEADAERLRSIHHEQCSIATGDSDVCDCSLNAGRVWLAKAYNGCAIRADKLKTLLRDVFYLRDPLGRRIDDDVLQYDPHLHEEVVLALDETPERKE